MNCIVSGGTGFIGRSIVARLLRDNHRVSIWSRNPGVETRSGGVAAFPWDPLSGEPPIESLDTMDTVIHLAGEPVAQRWSPAIKQQIRDSRVLGTRRLIDAIGRAKHKPTTLICASAIGIYGNRDDEPLTESSQPGTGFLVDVCKEWEHEADRAAQFGLRVVKLRIGFVLGKNGGALATMLPAFRMFAGGTLGSGRQWMPWVHIADVAEMFVHAAANHSVIGVWNATAPNPVTNAEFTRELANAVHRPAIIPIPRFALKLAFGEFAEHMLDSSRVIPAAALAAGFAFRYPDLKPALADLVA